MRKMLVLLATISFTTAQAQGAVPAPAVQQAQYNLQLFFDQIFKLIECPRVSAL
jgi:hypothetical protein